MIGAESAESIEKKRVEFLTGAKKSKRVRNDLNTKGIVRSGWCCLAGLKVESFSDIPPPVFL